MTLETESLRRELRAEICDLRDTVKQLVAQVVSLQDATAMLTRRMDAPVASSLEALVAGLRAENQRMKRELAQWERIAERDHGKPISGPGGYKCNACGERMKRYEDFPEYQHEGCGGLVELSKIVELRAERDELRETRAAIERQTAEAIAAWLEQRATEILSRSRPGTREGSDLTHRAAGLTDAVDALRAGTWKETP